MMAARRSYHVASFVAAALAVPSANDAARAQSTRPLSTDRPDRTESPYSVPAGLFQLEMDLVTFGRFESDGVTIDGLGVAPINLKYGITGDIDAQFLFAPYVRTSTTVGNGAEDTDDGTGPIGLRCKINLAGNDDGTTAVALLPYFLVPTRGEEKLDQTLYGLLVPVTLPLAGDRALGAMIGVEQLGGRETFGVASITISTPIAGRGAALWSCSRRRTASRRLTAGSSPWTPASSSHRGTIGPSTPVFTTVSPRTPRTGACSSGPRHGADVICRFWQRGSPWGIIPV